MVLNSFLFFSFLSLSLYSWPPLVFEISFCGGFLVNGFALAWRWYEFLGVVCIFFLFLLGPTMYSRVMRWMKDFLNAWFQFLLYTFSP